MRKTLSLLLAAVMVFGTIGTAFATTDAGNGTIVSYTGTGSEAYTITVPALLTPSSDGDVEAQGTWASNRKLVVTAPETVSLLNDISGADEKVLDVTFAGIAREGDNNRAITVTENIAVGAIEDALFGTWSGKIVYAIGMEDVAGSSAVTMLDGDGQTVNTFAMYDVRFRSSAPMDELQNVQVNGETVDPENYTVSEGSTIITFKPDFVASLGNGNHSVDINSQGGTASGSFTVTDEIPEDLVITDKYGKEISKEEFLNRTCTLEEYDCFGYGDYWYYYSKDEYGGWQIQVKDAAKEKIEYDPICSELAGEPVTNMLMAFEDCHNLIVAPKIPDTVTDMSMAFSHCYNLTTAPEIPEGVTNMSSTFAFCTSLTTAPAIPSSVTFVGTAFANCTSLTGTIEINANPTYYERFLGDTTQPIVLTGSSTVLADLAATATNDNVTVQAQAGGDTGDTNAIPYDPTKTEITLEEFGREPIIGDTFEYGDYSYSYESNEGEIGWLVSVLDKTKTEYGIVLNSIGGKPITNMMRTFCGCTNLTTAPAIPSTVTMMSSVFMECPNLTGTVTINASPYVAFLCFEGTTQPIQLVGNGSNGAFLENLASQYNNVTVAQ